MKEDLKSEVIGKTQQLMDEVQQKGERYMEKHFPGLRWRTGLIASICFADIVGFSFLLDAFNLREGVALLQNEEALFYFFFFVVANLVLPLIVINLFVFFYLTKAQKTLFQYFETGSADPEDMKTAVRRMEKLSVRMSLVLGVLFLLGNGLGATLGTSVYSTVFYVLTRLSLTSVMVVANSLALNLFVRRRLLHSLPLYELDKKISFFQRSTVVSALVSFILIVNALLVFTDVTLRVADQGAARLELIQQRSLNIVGNDMSEKVESDSPPSLEQVTEGVLGELGSGYLSLSLMIIFQSALIFAVKVWLQSRQLRDLQAKMSDLAEGAGDLTKEIRILEIDDMAIIISHLNKFIRGLRSRLLTVEEATGRVSRSSDILLEELQNTSSATEEMVASVDQINRTTASRTQIVEKTGQTLRSMIDSLEQVKRSVDTQASFVEQSSSAINEMAASIRSVSESTKHANTLSEHLSEAASEGGKAVRASISAVRDVEDSSEEVNSLVSSITKIAAQTNMLAMNAAIEAAHAGEAGKGFAVVAEEVRNLAESSSGSAKMITKQIQQMVEVVNNGVHMSENAGKALDRVLEDISQTTELINGIALAMDEQNAGATEILTSITSLVEATQEIKKISREEMSKNREMRISVDQVVQAFEEIKQATEEQSAGTSEMIKLVSQLKIVAEENEDVVRILSEQFSAFKLK